MDNALTLNKARLNMRKNYSLSELKPGQRATVTDIGVKGPQRRRLIDMGITPGAKIMMIKSAPFGDPIVIFIRGYELSMRKADAARVFISID